MAAKRVSGIDKRLSEVHEVKLNMSHGKLETVRYSPKYKEQSQMFTDVTPYQLAKEGRIEDLTKIAQTLQLTFKETDSDGRTLLHTSAIFNQCEMMDYLISCGNDLNAVDNNGDTALHLAVTNRHIEATKVLLSHGADDTILNKQSDAPLHIAARNDHGAMVATMLEYPINVTVSGFRNRTPLHVTAEKDNIEVLKVFHNHIANNKDKCFRLCAKDADDLTPIHLAARKGSHRVLDCIMNWCRDHGYSADQVLTFLDEENNTPLHTAVDSGHIEVVRVLLAHGASATESRISQVPPIHLACLQGKLKMVELMVQFGGVDVIACRDAFGQTPLHSSTLPPSTAVLCYLLNIGAQLNACNNQGQTPLITAIISGNLAAVMTLLKSGADPLIKDQNGDNPLHYAVQRNRTAIAKCLLDHSAAQQMLIQTNHSGSSPVHHALQKGFSALGLQMLELLKDGPLHELKDSQGCNYLHLAALGGDWKTITAIVNIHACQLFLNETNMCGSTPLHLATIGGHQRCVEILLSHGAMAHKCSHGFTPFLLACAKGQAECAKILYDAHPFQKSWSNDEGNNALHLAAMARSPACISLALDIGVPLTYNQMQDSFFDVVIENVDSESALAVIQHDRWSECLKFKSPLHPFPMLGLVMKLPEVAKAALDRCHTKSLLPRDHIDYWESYNFEHLKINTKAQQMPLIKDVEKNDPMELDASMPILTGNQHNNSLTISSSLEEQPHEILKKMAILRREALLNHIVVSAYIKQKWRSYGRYIFAFSLVMSFLQVLFLSLFVNRLFSDNQNITMNSTTNSNLSSGSFILAIITLFLTTLRAAWLFIYLIIYGYRVLNITKYLPLWIGGASVVTSYIFLLSAVIRGHEGTLWTAGALAAFFGWFGVALELSLFDLFGIYVVMFLHVTRTLFLVLFVCLPFFFAFGWAIYIVGSGDPSFTTIGFSLVTSFSYIIGQIDYKQFIQDDKDGTLSNAPLVFLLAILVAIILAIAFNNLLIGLAVGDIENVQKTAFVLRQLTHISTFTHLEKAMPKCLKQKFNLYDLKVYPNKKVPFIQQLWRQFWRAIKNVKTEDDISEGTAESQAQAQWHPEEKLLQLKRQVEEMTTRQERMLELIQQLHQSKMTAVEST
ncbi:hypothetical protein EMCRGX_G034559 [Ephydatia muelleri]